MKLSVAATCDLDLVSKPVGFRVVEAYGKFAADPVAGVVRFDRKEER